MTSETKPDEKTALANTWARHVQSWGRVNRVGEQVKPQILDLSSQTLSEIRTSDTSPAAADEATETTLRLGM